MERRLVERREERQPAEAHPVQPYHTEAAAIGEAIRRRYGRVWCTFIKGGGRRRLVWLHTRYAEALVEVEAVAWC